MTRTPVLPKTILLGPLSAHGLNRSRGTGGQWRRGCTSKDNRAARPCLKIMGFNLMRDRSFPCPRSLSARCVSA